MFRKYTVVKKRKEQLFKLTVSGCKLVVKGGGCLVLGFAPIEEAVEDFRRGKFVIVVDDEDRENEGDLIIAPEMTTPNAINFMSKFGRGLICVGMTDERLRELEIPLMVAENTAPHGCAFTVSVDATEKHGVTTGISASDRATTIRALVASDSQASDFNRPGHIFPLRAQPGGILRRAGHTEATVDLATLAGLSPAGVLCEILCEDGSMARLPDLEKLSKEHEIKIVAIAELIAHRRRTEKLVEHAATARVPTPFGDFQLFAYKSLVDETPYIALVKGDINCGEATLVRVHSGCLTGDTLFSLRCDCGSQLQNALECIAEEGSGVLLYIMDHEGRGIGLVNKIRAYALQDDGKDTVEANEHLGFQRDARDYGLGAQVLYDLGIRKIRLLTNNPAKRVGLEAHGLEIVERVQIQPSTSDENRDYLITKKEKLGHLLDM